MTNRDVADLHASAGLRAETSTYIEGVSSKCGSQDLYDARAPEEKRRIDRGRPQWARTGRRSSEGQGLRTNS
jgi:hypothetical protein